MFFLARQAPDDWSRAHACLTNRGFRSKRFFAATRVCGGIRTNCVKMTVKSRKNDEKLGEFFFQGGEFVGDMSFHEGAQAGFVALAQGL